MTQERLRSRDIASFVDDRIDGEPERHGSVRGVTVLFLAQLFGIELALGQQALVMLLSILGGVGTAGVPLPMVVIVLQSVGIPAEGIGIRSASIACST